MNTLVTIMIPNYNQDQYLEDAVDSALAQTYPNKQILVLDDCSSDNTKEVMKRYQGYQDVSYIRNSVNVGRVKNYRTGLYKYAEGEWVINLDGDDFFIDKTFIEAAIKLSEKDQNIVLISAERMEVSQIGEYSKLKDYRNPSNLDKSMTADGNTVFMGIPNKKYQIYHLTSLYRREVAMEIGFYRKDIISSDYESLYRLVLGKKVGFLCRKVAAWRSHDNNESRTMNIFTLIKNYEIFRDVYQYASENRYLNYFKRKKWLIDASSKKYYTNIISFSRDKCYKDIWLVSKFMLLNYPFAFVKTLLNPKLYLQLIISGFKLVEK